MEEILLGLLAVIWALGTPIVAIVALARTSRLREANERLAAEVALLRRQSLSNEGVPAQFVAPPAAIPAASTPAISEPAASEPAVEQVPPPPAPPFQPEPAVEGVSDPPSLPPPLIVDPVKVGWEQRLGARAFLWVGAITLALSAIFLVRYSIEEGYLSPEIRVILAALFGFALIAGAEKMRARDERVAQALAAAGVAALYGSLFSAVALYGMISKVAAGGGAAALTAFAIGVSLRHGIFVAGLAFVGDFASPMIIGSNDPNTPVLFGYLLAIAAGTMGVIRLKGWWPLGWGVLAGSSLWAVLWMMTTSDADELYWVGLFLVAVAGLFVWVTWKRMSASENPSKNVVALVWSALAVTGVLLVCLVIDDGGQHWTGWLMLALHGAGVYVLGRWTPRFQYAAALGSGLSLLALALWWGATGGAGATWDAGRFAWLAALFGGFYGAAAFALLWNAGRPGFWAALSVASMFTHFLLCWYVLRGTATGVPWGLISVGLAAPFLVGAERLSRWRSSMTGATEALGYLAAGVTFFIAAAIPMELSREWITVAYAVELAAVAAIAATLDLMVMRRLCWPLLAVVVVRFVLNPEVLKYPLGVTPIFNWILWGYGISIAALYVGLRLVRPTGHFRLALGIEATIGLLAFVLVTLEVRSLFQPGSMETPDAGFLERSFYVAIWGAFALAALWMTRRQRAPVTLWAWRLSGGLALATVLVIQVLVANPVFEPARLGQLPIANGLFLAYAVPAGMAVLARRWSDVEANRSVDLLLEVSASVLAFVYVSLEVRHLFDPGFERSGFDAAGLELYTYSIVWLLFAVALLALGFLRQTAAFRHAGMILVCIVVAKVFLIDMAGLQGLLRVFSFLGLGAALIGLGYVYRRFGFQQR